MGTVDFRHVGRGTWTSRFLKCLCLPPPPLPREMGFTELSECSPRPLGPGAGLGVSFDRKTQNSVHNQNPGSCVQGQMSVQGQDWEQGPSSVYEGPRSGLPRGQGVTGLLPGDSVPCAARRFSWAPASLAGSLGERDSTRPQPADAGPAGKPPAGNKRASGSFPGPRGPARPVRPAPCPPTGRTGAWASIIVPILWARQTETRFFPAS